MLIFNIYIMMVTTMTTVVVAEFSCLCNYKADTKVMSQPNDNATTLGYMYEFDCKPEAPNAGLKGYHAVQFQNQQGYVKMAPEIQIQVCKGTPPADDKITTMPPKSTPSVDSTILPETTPLADSTILPGSTPLMDSTILPESTLFVDSTIPAETTPLVDSTIPPESTPLVDSTILPESTPLVDSTILPETTLLVDSTILPETTPMVDKSTVTPQSMTSTVKTGSSVMIQSSPMMQESTLMTNTPPNIEMSTPIIELTTETASSKPIVSGSTLGMQLSPLPSTHTLVTVDNTPVSTIRSSTMSAVTTEKAVMSTVNTCHEGYVQCKDGRCEPFPSLCGKTGYITTKAPPTTEPLSTAVMETTSNKYTTSANTAISTVTASTGDISQSTVSVVTVGPGACLDGWEECEDGTCEPFHWLCKEHGGAFQTIVPVPVTGAPVSVAVSTDPSMSPTDSAGVTTNAVDIFSASFNTAILESSTVMTSTVPVASACYDGWEQCPDGTCEPFHWLCLEHGGPIVTVHPPAITSPPSVAVSTDSIASVSTLAMSTTSSISATMDTSTPSSIESTIGLSTPSSNTYTTGSATVPITNGPSGQCKEGWEYCADKTCEPYHWLCMEHTETGLVG